MTIYEDYEPILDAVLDEFEDCMSAVDARHRSETGEHLFEHILGRIKSDESMRDKLRRKSLREDAASALTMIKDAIGIRIICSFIDDLYKVRDIIDSIDGLEIIEEKDYIRHAKPNGYRSYHLILKIDLSFVKRAIEKHCPDLDIEGYASRQIRQLYAEVQLRTIAMDSWAALEHRLKYKKNIKNQDVIVAELKRCADEMAGCDLSMQTIRDLILKE